MGKVVVWGATELAYSVQVLDGGQPVDEYMAGNSALESQGYLSADSPSAVGEETMREWAEQTAREMAEEFAAEYGGEDQDESANLRDMLGIDNG